MYKIAANISRHSLDTAREVWRKERQEDLVIVDTAHHLLVIADSLEDAYAGAVFAHLRYEGNDRTVTWVSPSLGVVRTFTNLKRMSLKLAEELAIEDSEILHLLSW